MPAIPSEISAVRKRRAHNKSRRGCRNCKLRRVKCDETRPQCQKCSVYGVVCNYDPNTPDLQVASAHGLHFPAAAPKGNLIQFERPRSPLRSAMICADAVTSFELDTDCLDRLERFRSRTVFSFGEDAMGKLYQGKILEMAFYNPYLMHIILTLTAAHDRHLSTPGHSRRTLTEIYHSTQSVALFNRKLSKPLQPQDQDPLWATATLVGIIVFSSLDASSPEEAWPLKPDEPSDLEWIRMSEGKAAVWRLTNPMRPDSIFRVMADMYMELHGPIAGVGSDGIPPELASLCRLEGTSTPENNPYFVAAHTLAPLRRLPREQRTKTVSLRFIFGMQPSFKKLLEEKDPVALVLLTLWYDASAPLIWWVELRAVVEREAICLYLRRHYKENTAVLELLP